jgi:hypothetical protein
MRSPPPPAPSSDCVTASANSAPTGGAAAPDGTPPTPSKAAAPPTGKPAPATIAAPNPGNNAAPGQAGTPAPATSDGDHERTCPLARHHHPTRLRHPTPETPHPMETHRGQRPRILPRHHLPHANPVDHTRHTMAPRPHTRPHRMDRPRTPTMQRSRRRTPPQPVTRSDHPAELAAVAHFTPLVAICVCAGQRGGAVGRSRMVTLPTPQSKWIYLQ